MTNPKYTIKPEDVEWEMDWRSSPGKEGLNDKEIVFEDGHALALLLINEVLFLNDQHNQKSWPPEARSGFYIGVDCSDIFAWGCSDLEEAKYADIEPLYQLWKKDSVWGAAIWSMIRRRQMPQAPVEKKIRETGIWDLDALKEKYGLRPNIYDSIHRVFARRKYDTYALWQRSIGKKELPFNAGWWDGWNKYTKAYPDWNDDRWKAIDQALKNQWLATNGY